MRSYYKMSTWTVRGLNAKVHELELKFEKAKLELLIISETKRKGKGIKETSNGHLLVSSGVDKEMRASAGVACIVHRAIKNDVNRWMAVSERIITVELRNTEGTRTVIGVYGPDECERAENKNTFWERMNQTVEEAKGVILIAGDLKRIHCSE